MALKFAGKYFIIKKTNRDWIKDQIIQDGTMFVFLFDSNIDSNVKDFVEENFWSEIGTKKLCSDFNPGLYCTKLKDLQKNIETIFGGTEREEVSKNLIKLFEVSMEHFSDDVKNRYEVINWYFKMGLFEKYENLFRVALKNSMFVTNLNPMNKQSENYLLPLKNLLEIYSDPALAKDAAIQRPDLIIYYMLKNTDKFGGLFYLIEESTKENGKKVMFLFNIERELLKTLKDYSEFDSVFGKLTYTAIRSNWESLKEIIDYHKIISEAIAWDLVYEAVKNNFAAIQYIKDTALIVDI